MSSGKWRPFCLSLNVLRVVELSWNWPGDGMNQELITTHELMYRQVSNIRRTKSQHLKDSRTVLRLSLPNPLKPDVKSRMKM